MGPTKYFLDWQKILVAQVIYYSDSFALAIAEKKKNHSPLNAGDYPSLANLAFCLKKDPLLKKFLANWVEKRIMQIITNAYKAGAFKDRSLGPQGLMPRSRVTYHVELDTADLPAENAVNKMEAAHARISRTLREMKAAAVS